VTDPGREEGSASTTTTKVARQETRGFAGFVRRKLIEPVLGLEDTPERLTRGVVVGLFVALTPTVGGQMLIVLGAAWACRANKIAAVAMVWITNPLTVVPYYYGAYRLGLLVADQPALTYGAFRRLLPGGDQGIADSFKAIFQAFGWPLLLGATVIAVVASAASYPFVLRYFRRREADRRARRE
jgi:uncharacterized protein (DUF2062 family)